LYGNILAESDGKWAMRYHVLGKGAVKWYANQLDKEPLGSVELKGMEASETLGKGRVAVSPAKTAAISKSNAKAPISFSSQPALHLEIPDEDERKKWLSALSQNITWSQNELVL